jgi:alginate O-acetyltransferase complex protein AlgI
MVFSSPTFLFLFLPCVLAVYFVTPVRLKNFVLLIASLFFYAWGEGLFVAIMMASIVFNYSLGLLVAKFRGHHLSRVILGLAIAGNLCLFIVFKYTNFLVENFNIVLAQFSLDQIEVAPIHLPIGISFFTFQAISYIIDVYRKEVPVEKNFITVALYISLFPQLIAGPIVRYHDISKQLLNRKVDFELFGDGVKRFILGFGKKMIIANPLGEVADNIFALPANELPLEVAWIGIICYSLQIYFDFSGYSDMAIGLGKMFGFRFLENFNFPYISESIQEFWRRWHISLSSWFRDYLYIPLGGNRSGSVRTYFNLLTIFVLCGLWHGASWNFLIWGLIHGMFLVLERLWLKSAIESILRPLRHVYVLLVVMFAWVFFRADTLPSALEYIVALFGMNESINTNIYLGAYIDSSTIFAIFIGILASLPVYPWFFEKLTREPNNVTGSAAEGASTSTEGSDFTLEGAGKSSDRSGRDTEMSGALKNGFAISFEYLWLMLVLSIGIAYLAADTYNPFIYFRF